MCTFLLTTDAPSTRMDFSPCSNQPPPRILVVTFSSSGFTHFLKLSYTSAKTNKYTNRKYHNIGSNIRI